MRSGCAPSVCEDAARSILPWLVVAIGLAAIGHLAWEAAQLPLYTLWSTGTSRAIGFALVHCTGGDVLISTATLLMGGILAGLRGWHLFGSRMLVTVIGLGVAYTTLSEGLNVGIWRSWSYSSAMPVSPWLGIGLSPVLQWLVVPVIALGITFGWRTILNSQTPRR